MMRDVIKVMMLGVVLAVFKLAAATQQPPTVSVSQVTVTVSNLTQSLSFYTKILGGMYAEGISSMEPTAEEEYVRMFIGEKMNISIKGDNSKEEQLDEKIQKWQVAWAYVILDNTMIQLVQLYKPAEKTDEKTDENNREKKTTAVPGMDMMSMMGTSIAFWVMDDVNFTAYLQSFEKESNDQGYQKVKLNKPLLLADTSAQREANSGVNNLREDKLQGLSIAYATGPDGEKIKFIQLVNSSRIEFGKHYCKAEMVNSALLDNSYVDKCGAHKKGLSSQLNGLNHISIMTKDINKTVDFYVNKLGGYFIDDIQPSHLQSPSLCSLMPELPPPTQEKNNGDKEASFTDKVKPTGTVKEESVDKKETGGDKPVLSNMTKPPGELNLRYVLLGNIKIEIAYISGMSPGLGMMATDGPMMMAMRGRDSSANTKSGSVKISVHFDSTEDLQSFINQTSDYEILSENVTDIVTGPLSGLRYAVLIGPNGETIKLLHHAGQHRHVLHRHLKDYDSVNKIFDDMNPWKQHGYYEFCERQQLARDEL